MKYITLFLLFVLACGGTWVLKQRAATPPPSASENANAGRKILYYQSPMHPWIKSDKPGKCPICGMNLVPVYASIDDTGTYNDSSLKLNTDSVSVANVQTLEVERLQIVRSLRVAGVIEANGIPAQFIFTAYERDFVWLKTNQTVEVSIPALPGKNYTARIFAIGPNRDDPTHSLQVKATLSENVSPVEGGFYAEGRVQVEMAGVLAVPRSAVLSPGGEPFVYVDAGSDRYERRKIKIGRIGDDYAEVLDGLKEGEHVVTSGNVLIDAEAQISQSTDN